jgi:hypothetical protein
MPFRLSVVPIPGKQNQPRMGTGGRGGWKDGRALRIPKGKAAWLKAMPMRMGLRSQYPLTGSDGYGSVGGPSAAFTQ